MLELGTSTKTPKEQRHSYCTKIKVSPILTTLRISIFTNSPQLEGRSPSSASLLFYQIRIRP